jgi:hypothetical protein
MSKHIWTIAAAGMLAASSAAVVQAAQGASSHRGAHVVSTSANYSKSMDELMRAAQRLRESIQALSQQQPGTERDTALNAAREALYDTQQAMIQLPPELRNTQRSGGVSPAYSESMRQLQQASDRLYDSLHAMARQPAGERRNAAMREAQEALLETEYAIAWLPNAGGSGTASTAGRARSSAENDRWSARGTASSSAASGSVGGTATAASSASHPSSGIDAVAGGVGVNARARLSSEAAPDHNVKMVFSLNTGNYLSDVHVRVTDQSGRAVIDGTAQGPWLYARLPAGTYTATASYRGQSVTEKFSVGTSGQRVAHFRWPAMVEQQAAASAGVSPILGTGPQEP